MSDSKSSPNSRVKCRAIMSKNISSIAPDTSLSDAAKTLRDSDVGILPVVDGDGRLVGLITDRDIVVRGVAESMTAETRVDSIMTTEIFSARPDEFAFEAARLMGDKQVRRIPITDQDDKLVGIISMADIALEMEDEKEIAETLEEISSGSAFWGKR